MENNKSKVIVITGASSGIGEATALELAKAGHKIVLAARREERLKKLVEKIKKHSSKTIYQVTDVSLFDDVKKLAEKAVSEFGQIDVWLNNAGIMPQSTFDKYKVKEWEQMVDVNIKGVLYGIAAALPVMREKKAGHFINLSSIAGHIVHSGSGVYSATKFAVLAISEALRQEEAIAKSNIRVTVISPGAIATELTHTISDETTKAGIDSFYEKFAITPDRIAKTIAFAIDMPDDTDLNEIIIRPSAQQM